MLVRADQAGGPWISGSCLTFMGEYPLKTIFDLQCNWTKLWISTRKFHLLRLYPAPDLFSPEIKPTVFKIIFVNIPSINLWIHPKNCQFIQILFDKTVLSSLTWFGQKQLIRCVLEFTELEWNRSSWNESINYRL